MSKNKALTMIVAVFVFVTVAGITGHFLFGGTAKATGAAEPLVTVVATIAPSAEPTEQPAPTRPATENGHSTEAAAQAECSGIVEPLYSRGEIRGWTCIIGGGEWGK